MRAPGFARQTRTRPALLLVAALLPAGFASAEEGDWTTEHIPPAAPWRERAVDLPGYPQPQDLLEISVQTGNYPYRVFVDRASLATGEDGVVRYAVVVRSQAGAENVSFEGIHCKERRFRRYAYGYDDSWQTIDGDDWQPLHPGGMGHYRFVLYRDYVCDPSNPRMKVNEMIQRMRYSRGAVLDD